MPKKKKPEENKPAVDPIHIHDLHATWLHLLGIDHLQLTYRFERMVLLAVLFGLSASVLTQIQGLKIGNR